jgi:hypothetical protein
MPRPAGAWERGFDEVKTKKYPPAANPATGNPRGATAGRSGPKKSFTCARFLYQLEPVYPYASIS